MGILTTRGFKRATYRTLRKPYNSLSNFCHRCQKPEGGVVLGIDILLSIYVTLLYLNYVKLYYDPGFKGIQYVCIFVIADVRMGNCYECLAVRQCTAMYIFGALCSLCTHSQYSSLVS